MSIVRSNLAHTPIFTKSKKGQNKKKWEKVTSTMYIEDNVHRLKRNYAK